MVIPHSRTKIVTVTHQGSSPMIDKPDEGHTGQCLVRDRIGELAEARNDVVLASQVSVKGVGQDRHAEDHRSQNRHNGCSG